MTKIILLEFFKKLIPFVFLTFVQQNLSPQLMDTNQLRYCQCAVRFFSYAAKMAKIYVVEGFNSTMDNRKTEKQSPKSLL